MPYIAVSDEHLFRVPDEGEIIELPPLRYLARALSRLPRFNGHGTGVISVAAHSVALSKFVKQKRDLPHILWTGAARWALLHDVHEALLTDMPSPWKPLFPDFERAEESMERAVAHTYMGIRLSARETDRIRALVKEAEHLMVAVEAEYLGLEAGGWARDRRDEAGEEAVVAAREALIAQQDAMHGEGAYQSYLLACRVHGLI